jgi:hypothetical protein
MSDEDDFIKIDVDSVETETARAVLFIIDEEKVWIPKSQIDEWSSTWVTVKTWFAEKEGLV